MRTICIYHKNCFDGICAAWIVKKWHPEAELMTANYGDEFPFNLYGKNDNIIIVDFSFPRHIMESIDRECASLLVLDHHKTALANCDGLHFCKFDMNESGASMAWKHFFPHEPMPHLVRYIRDRDLWLYQEASSEEINSFIQSYPMTVENYEALYQQLETFDGQIHAKVGGEAILRYKNTMVEAMCKNAAFDKEGIPTVNASILFSEVGNQLCKMYPNAPYAAYYFDRLVDSTRQWGLRSIGDFDVSEVAKSHGGGGHRNAAGFQESLFAL